MILLVNDRIWAKQVFPNNHVFFKLISGFGVVALCFFILTLCETGFTAILVLSFIGGFFGISVSGKPILYLR